MRSIVLTGACLIATLAVAVPADAQMCQTGTCGMSGGRYFMGDPNAQIYGPTSVQMSAPYYGAAMSQGSGYAASGYYGAPSVGAQTMVAAGPQYGYRAAGFAPTQMYAAPQNSQVLYMAPQASVAGNLPLASAPNHSAAYGSAGCGVGVSGSCTDGSCGVGSGAGACVQGPGNAIGYQAVQLNQVLAAPRRQRFTAYAGAIFLERVGPDDQVLVINADWPAEQVNAGNFNWDFAPGVEGQLLFHDDCGVQDLELRYFGIQDWSETHWAPSYGDNHWVLMRGPEVFNGDREYIASYESEFDSAEVNLRQRRCCNDWLTAIAGFRYFRLSETLNVTLQDHPNAPAYDDETFRTRTENHLFGFQIGSDIRLIQRCNGCLNLVAKTGIYANRNRQWSTWIDPAGTITLDADDTSLATVSELGINYTHCLSKCSSFKFGYQALWLNGIATAPRQYRTTDFGSYAAGIDNQGDVFLHGCSCGLQVCF